MDLRREKKCIVAGALIISMIFSSIPANCAAEGEMDVNGESFFGCTEFHYGAVPNERLLPVERESCTGEEWKGTGNNLDITSVNTLPDSSNLIPYSDVKTAYYGARDYAREKSDRYQLLTGEGQEWDLTVLDSPKEADALGEFEKAGYQEKKEDGWKSVTLPASWTSYGFDHSIYTNSVMPFEQSMAFPEAPVDKNPVGLYRREFTVDDSLMQDNGKIYITLGGVESAYYLYVNGVEAGYSEDSYDPHTFDITDLLNKKGEKNLLAVRVMKFCDGTWLEDQDMIYDGGIFRDVYLTGTPAVHMQDYTVKTQLYDDYTFANVHVTLDTANDSVAESGSMAARVSLYDDKEKLVTSVDTEVGKVASGRKESTELDLDVDAPKLWDCDHPNLYTMVISLYDRDSGLHYESISQNIGFRQLEFTSTKVTDDGKYNNDTDYYDMVTLNGKRLMIKGVNRHDTDVETGKYVSKKIYETDIRLMKENNINAVRTSHYPNDDYFYYLCDKYGLYVMCESNNESHAIYSNEGQLSRLETAALTRQSASYERFKNTTCNLFWSIGNESSQGWSERDGNYANGMFAHLVQFFKDRDSSRMVHYEGMSGGRKGSTGIDMVSHMYYDPASIMSYAQDESRMPFILCEYDHAMGNAVGNLKEYWDIIRKYDNMLGGFIWDWVDQSRKVAIDDGDWDYYGQEKAHTSGLYDLKGYYLGYGGDWGNSYSGDKNFCQNGLLSADRDPQPEIKEVKYQYQNFWFTSKDDILKDQTIHVKNESISDELSEYETIWQLRENDTVIDQGTVTENVGPQQEKDIIIPFTLPSDKKKGAQYYLNISVKTKDAKGILHKDQEIAYAQIQVAEDAQCGYHKWQGDEVNVEKNDSGYEISGKDFHFRFDAADGTMSDYYYGDKLLIKKGPQPNVFRAKLDNDRTKYSDFMSYLTMDGEPEVSRSEDGCPVITVKWLSSYKIDTKTNEPGVVTMKYTIENNGAVTVDVHYDLTKTKAKKVAKLGTIMTLAEGMEQVQWYGNGDSESYNDRQSYTRKGVYDTTVSDMYYPFAMPQDCGNLTGVKWIRISQKDENNSILICAGTDINASALHFSPKQLQDAAHVNKLSPSKDTYLTIDGLVKGTGNGSCGYETLSDYQVPQKVFDYRYTIIPAGQETDSMETSVEYRQSDNKSVLPEPTVLPEAPVRPSDRPVVRPTRKPANPAITPAASQNVPTQVPTAETSSKPAGEEKTAVPALQPSASANADAVTPGDTSPDVTSPTAVPADKAKKVRAKKVTGLKGKSYSKGISLSWRKQSAKYYIVAYSTSKKRLSALKTGQKKSAGVKLYKVKKNRAELKKLKKGKRYYIKVCATNKKFLDQGKWSAVTAVRYKKK